MAPWHRPGGQPERVRVSVFLLRGRPEFLLRSAAVLSYHGPVRHVSDRLLCNGGEVQRTRRRPQDARLLADTWRGVASVVLFVRWLNSATFAR